MYIWRADMFNKLNKTKFLALIFTQSLFLTSLLLIPLFSFIPANDSKIQKPKSKLNIECLVTVDGMPTSALVEINSVLKNKGLVFNASTDKLNGICRAGLEPGDDYEIVVRTPKFPQQIIQLKATHIDSTTYMNVYADFTSPAYDNKLKELKNSIAENTEAKSKGFNQADFIRKFGDKRKKDLRYKIQVGAYKFTENFNYNSVIGLPKIIRQLDTDKVPRFTMGDYATYLEALILMKKLEQNGIKDKSVIVAYYKSARKMIHQLVDEKIIP